MSSVATPEFQVSSGTYNGQVIVGITCATEGAYIYYTTDGTTPTHNGEDVLGTTHILSGGQFTLYSSGTVKAIGVDYVHADSEMVSIDLVINPYPLTLETVQHMVNLLGAIDVDMQRIIDPTRNESGSDPVSAYFGLFKISNLLFSEIDNKDNPESLITLASTTREKKQILANSMNNFLASTCLSLDAYIKSQNDGLGLLSTYQGSLTLSSAFNNLWARLVTG